MRPGRIGKSLETRLHDLDDNLFVLRDTLEGLRFDEAHLKTLAAHLRSLVCLSSGTEGLLWRLADELGVSDEIELHLAGEIDPEHPLAKGLTFAIAPLHRAGRGPPQIPPEPYPLRFVIKETEALYIRGEGLAHENLIKDVSQQLGAAHEAEGVDPSLVDLSRIRISGVKPYVQVLAKDAELVLQVGERILEKAENELGFERKDRQRQYGEFTVAVRVQLLEQLAGRVPVISVRSPVSEVEINCIAGPLSWIFQVAKRDDVVDELSIEYPDHLREKVDVVFGLEYSSSFRQAHLSVNGESNDDGIDCDLGYVHGRELTDLEVHDQREELVAIQFPAVFGKCIGPERLAHLREASREEVAWAVEARKRGEI